MARIPEPVQNLVDAFSRLPGIGPRTASRLTFYLLKNNEAAALQLADALENLAAGYDFLAGRRRAPWLRRLAAQCRRGVRALQACAGVRAGEIPNTRADVCAQRRSEQALRDLLDQLDGPCREAAARLRRESMGRSRVITRLR